MIPIIGQFFGALFSLFLLIFIVVAVVGIVLNSSTVMKKVESLERKYLSKSKVSHKE